MDRSLRCSGIACVFLISVSAVHKIFVGPIIAAAIRHLKNSKSVCLGIGGIELASELVILDSVMMKTALAASFVLLAALSVFVRCFLLAVGLTRAKQSFSCSIMPHGVLVSTTIFFLMHA